MPRAEGFGNWTDAELLSFVQAVEQNQDQLFNRNKGSDVRGDLERAWAVVAATCVANGFSRFAGKKMDDLNKNLWQKKAKSVRQKYDAATETGKGAIQWKAWESIIIGMIKSSGNADGESIAESGDGPTAEQIEALSLASPRMNQLRTPKNEQMEMRPTNIITKRVKRPWQHEENFEDEEMEQKCLKTKIMREELCHRRLVNFQLATELHLPATITISGMIFRNTYAMRCEFTWDRDTVEFDADRMLLGLLGNERNAEAGLALSLHIVGHIPLPAGIFRP